MWFRGRVEVLGSGWGEDHGQGGGAAVCVPAAVTAGTMPMLENEWTPRLTIYFSLETCPVILLCA